MWSPHFALPMLKAEHSTMSRSQQTRRLALLHQGGFVELALPEAGRYALVSHVMVDAERGAAGSSGQPVTGRMPGGRLWLTRFG